MDLEVHKKKTLLRKTKPYFTYLQNFHFFAFRQTQTMKLRNNNSVDVTTITVFERESGSASLLQHLETDLAASRAELCNISSRLLQDVEPIFATC